MRKRTGKTFLFCGMGAVIVSLMFLFDGGGVFSHSGRTDSSGGHYNRKTGGYHYHGTPKSSTSTYSSSTASSSGTQSSAIQSSGVPSSEIAELTNEIRSLRASVETLNRSVQTLITRMGAPAGKTFDNTMVYITRTGAKYHRDGCRYLKSSKIPISLTDAKKQYSPCSVCNP